MLKKHMKFIFMGTPKFGEIILEGLIKKNYKPVLIITAPDKPMGRKQIVTPPPVKIIAEKNNIPVLQPEKIKNIIPEIKKINPDLIVVAAFGQIVPMEILKIPKYGCLNVHPSLLPKYRGPAPIQYAILNGEKETGITIILMDEKIDHGKIISSSKFLISNKKINYQELTQELAKSGTELLIKTIPDWINGRIKPLPQNESKSTYTKISKKEDGKIDWNKPAKYIERQIRAFNSWPGTFSKIQDNKLKFKILKIINAEILPIKIKKQVGEIFLTGDEKLAVQTGQNCLIMKELQLEGKKPMSAQDFLRGHRKIIGIILQ